MLGEAAEAVAFQALAAAQLGPRLLGMFPGGRLEEFLDAANLNFDQCRDDHVLQKVAQLMAKFHSLKVPISKDTEIIRQVATKNIEAGIDAAKTVDIEKFKPEVQTKMRNILSYDLLDEYRWVATQAAKIASHVVFSHNDCYVNNLMVNAGSEGMKLLVVDVDSVYYRPRGCDMAFILSEASTDYGDTSRVQFRTFVGSSRAEVRQNIPRHVARAVS